jgi:hypothetical protein
MNKLPLFFVSVLILFAATASGGTLHLIAVGDTMDERIGPYAFTDVSSISSIFTEGVARDQLSITTLIGETDFNSDRIRRAVDDLRVASDDAVVLYFSGHGAFDDTGHFLDVAGKRLYRSELVSILRARSCRLQILLTDACFNERVVQPRVAYATKAGPDVTTPLFRSLFFESRGFLDLNSCQRGQRAFTRNDYREGSVFTAAFVSLLKKNLRNGGIEWTQLLRESSSQTNRDFRRFVANKRGQKSQDPAVFANTIRQTDTSDGVISNSRLGVDISFRQGNAVIIAAHEGSASRKLKLAGDSRRWVLDPGDIINSINGRRVTSPDDFMAAVQTSRSSMVLSVWSEQDGKTYEFTAQLP